jgi:hypothetical protein
MEVSSVSYSPTQFDRFEKDEVSERKTFAAAAHSFRRGHQERCRDGFWIDHLVHVELAEPDNESKSGIDVELENGDTVDSTEIG